MGAAHAGSRPLHLNSPRRVFPAWCRNIIAPLERVASTISMSRPAAPLVFWRRCRSAPAC